MKCNKCYSQNGDSRKCCHNCGSILVGYTYNNVNGKYGYRGEDGIFYKNKESYLINIDSK